MDNVKLSALEELLHSCKKVFYIIGLFTVFINIFALALPIYTIQLFNRILPSSSIETLVYLTLLVFMILAVVAGLEIARGQLLIHISHWIDEKLTAIAIDKSADHILLGDKYGNQVLYDVSLLRQFLASQSIFAFFDAPWVPVYLIVIFLLHWLLGSVAIVATVILFGMAFANERLTSRIIKQAAEAGTKSGRYIDVALRNVEVVQGMGMMSNVIKEWEKYNKPAIELQDEVGYRAGLISSITRLLRMALQVIMLAVGAFLVIENQITAGAMFAASILLSRELAPVEQAIGAWKHFVVTKAAYGRLKEFFNKESIRNSNIRLPRPKGFLVVENLSYVVPGTTKPVLFNVSFQIPPGEMMAIIGNSGAGKSSLVRFIVGALKPSQGTIRLDGADVFTWNRDDFGRYVGYLPQDIELFSATIKQNISRLQEGENDEKVVAAALMANCHEMILRFPKAYNTMVNVEQFALSGGQRQRIGLARALYDNPAVVVLDEPDSNLDDHGEAALVHALTTLRKQGVTVVLVTHKSYLVKLSSRILVLADGTIQLYGPTNEVLEMMTKKRETAVPPKPSGEKNGPV